MLPGYARSKRYILHMLLLINTNIDDNDDNDNDRVGTSSISKLCNHSEPI